MRVNVSCVLMVAAIGRYVSASEGMFLHQVSKKHECAMITCVHHAGAAFAWTSVQSKK